MAKVVKVKILKTIWQHLQLKINLIIVSLKVGLQFVLKLEVFSVFKSSLDSFKEEGEGSDKSNKSVSSDNSPSRTYKRVRSEHLKRNRNAANLNDSDKYKLDDCFLDKNQTKNLRYDTPKKNQKLAQIPVNKK
jgi:hypothetical protein